MKSQNYNPRKKKSGAYTYFRTPQWIRDISSKKLKIVANTYRRARKWFSEKNKFKDRPWQKPQEKKRPSS
ncbi:MAG: hypothetical protein PHG63_02015 [Candidatus Dojkabacteria bacterium]|nr:hypothetical protein [Candidatus Dojkabacteria bacterium]